MESIEDRILADFVNNDIEFVTTVPCKQLAGVIAKLESCDSIYHIPSNKEDDASELDSILKYTFMCNKPVAILTDATFWKGY
jgi:sulfopyruvate decarboxylase TPP-binding subunit